MTKKCTDYRNNFYLGVNRKWLEDPVNTIPSEYPRWGGFIKLHDDGLKNQIGLVKELCYTESKTNLNESQKKIVAIWEASNTRFKSWDENNASYSHVLKELEYLEEVLPEWDPKRMADYLYYCQMNGISNVFDFDKESDYNNTENVILDLTACGMSLPSRDYYIDDKFADKREQYVAHLTNVRDLVTKAGGKLSNTFVQDVMKYESDIAVISMSPDQRRKYTEYYNNTTLTNLYEKINDLRYLPEKDEHYPEDDKKYEMDSDTQSKVTEFLKQVYIKFDFVNVLDSNRAKHYTDPETGKIKKNAPELEQIYVYDGDSFRRTMRLIMDYDRFNEYKSFLQYKIIRAYEAYTTKELDEEFFNFYSRQMNGTQEQQSRDKRSMNVINSFAGELMGQVYVKRYFSESDKLEVKKMISYILKTMEKSLKSNDWLTHDTKGRALDKLSKFGVKIGYPDVWKDYSDFFPNIGDSMYDIMKKCYTWLAKHEFFDKLNAPKDNNEWGMNPQVVNAYFSPLQNEIVFPAAILQPPFFSTKVEQIDFDYSEEVEQKSLDSELILYAVNCGGIGAVIAHEITHGYDDEGKKFDGDGNMVEWWTEEDSNLFKDKTELMRKQTEKYSFTLEIDNEETKENEVKTYNMNADLTMGENLADLGGMSLGLQTLNAELTIYGITDNLLIKSYHRIFFKSFANIWRLNIKDDYRVKLINIDPHAPTDFRANLVANIDEFYSAFDVVEGDSMYLPPDARLRMW